MVNFDFLEKGLGIVFQHILCIDLLRKMFLILHLINWPNFIVWLPELLEILDNMYIAVVCFPGCDLINLEINLIFLIKPFLFMTKKSRQKFKYIENEELLRWNKEHFSLFLKGFELPKIVLDLRVRSLSFCSKNTIKWTNICSKWSIKTQ